MADILEAKGFKLVVTSEDLGSDIPVPFHSPLCQRHASKKRLGRLVVILAGALRRLILSKIATCVVFARREISI